MRKRKLNRKEKRKIANAYALITQIAINVLVIIFGCFFLGRFLDGVLGTSPWLMLFFLLLGILSAFRNIYVVAMSTVKDEE